MPRITPPAPADMTPRQREVHDAIASGPRGRVEGPLAVWLRRPELAQKAQELGAYCRYGTSLPPRLSELAILTMARVWTAEFEWWAHKGPALDGGLAPVCFWKIVRQEVAFLSAYFVASTCVVHFTMCCLDSFGGLCFSPS